VVVACLPLLTWAGDWTQFRGPNNSGVAADSQAPSEWSADKNLAWKQKIPGYGWSSPIIVGDKIIVTTAVTEKQRRPEAVGGQGAGGGFAPPPGGKKDGPPGGGQPNGPPPGGYKGGPGAFGDPRPPDAVYRWEIHCLDRNTGKTLWSQVAL